MQSGFVLTNKQADKLKVVVNLFYEKAIERDSFDGLFMLLLNSVRIAINQEDPIEQYQIDAITWIIESIIEQYEDNDIDPGLEQCYHKLTGYWFEDIEPWYKRLKDLDNAIIQPE